MMPKFALPMTFLTRDGVVCAPAGEKKTKLERSRDNHNNNLKLSPITPFSQLSKRGQHFSPFRH